MIAEFKGDYTKMTCGGCVRFTENWKTPGTYECCDIDGPKSIYAATPACKDYWDKAEQDALEAAERAETEKARRHAWEQNKDNPPRPAKWVRDYDGIRECLTGAMPFCPNCDEPLYTFLFKNRKYERNVIISSGCKTKAEVWSMRLIDADLRFRECKNTAPFPSAVVVLKKKILTER